MHVCIVRNQIDLQSHLCLYSFQILQQVLSGHQHDLHYMPLSWHWIHSIKKYNKEQCIRIQPVYYSITNVGTKKTLCQWTMDERSDGMVHSHIYIGMYLMQVMLTGFVQCLSQPYCPIKSRSTSGWPYWAAASTPVQPPCKQHAKRSIHYFQNESHHKHEIIEGKEFLSKSRKRGVQVENALTSRVFMIISRLTVSCNLADNEPRVSEHPNFHSICCINCPNNHLHPRMCNNETSTVSHTILLGLNMLDKVHSL